MFNLILKDRTIIDSNSIEWRNISEQYRVKYQSGYKTVFLCTLPVEKIIIKHNDLETEMEVPAGYKVYQAIRAGTTFYNGVSKSEISGRCVGLVKDGEVVEERVLNGVENIIQGWRK